MGQLPSPLALRGVLGRRQVHAFRAPDAMVARVPFLERGGRMSLPVLARGDAARNHGGGKKTETAEKDCEGGLECWRSPMEVLGAPSA